MKKGCWCLFESLQSFHPKFYLSIFIIVDLLTVFVNLNLELEIVRFVKKNSFEGIKKFFSS
jgi:hypothetical protein